MCGLFYWDKPMKLYVACLASYSHGVLHGEWISLAGVESQDVRHGIARILREAEHGPLKALHFESLRTQPKDPMDVEKVEAVIDKLIADASNANAQSQWLRFVAGALAFCTVAVLTKLML